MNERIVAGRTEPPDMREKGKHGDRSAGFMERRVIVHRSADRGAVCRRLGRSLSSRWVHLSPPARSGASV